MQQGTGTISLKIKGGGLDPGVSPVHRPQVHPQNVCHRVPECHTGPDWVIEENGVGG